MRDYEKEKRIPICNTTMENIIRNKGYYDINGNWNSIVQVIGYDGYVFRERVEVIIFKGNKIYMCMENNSHTVKYRIPGGSTEKNVINIDQVINEAREEAKILIKDVKCTGISYINLFSHRRSASNNFIRWDGTYNTIYIANYNSDYKGKVNPTTFDHNMYNYGKFYKLKDVYNILTPNHKKVIDIITQSRECTN